MKLKINWKIFAIGIFLGVLLSFAWFKLLNKGVFFNILMCFLVLINFLESLHLVYNFQLKEYRFDRFLDGIKTASGKKRVWLNFWKVKSLFSVIILLLWQLKVEAETFNFWLVVLGFFCLGIGLVEFSFRILEKKLFRPKITAKVVLIVLSVIFGGLFLMFFSGLNFETSLFLWLILPIGLILNIGIVLFLKPFTWILKMMIVYFASLKMKLVKPKVVVGITGSYGKSSTKNFLNQIAKLSDKKTFVTEGNVNSEIGVAIEVLKKLKKNVEVMIVEMGAYKKGEIAKIAKMVKPEIAIITAVENQHLSLFGSLEKIKEAKFELIESTKKTGVVIVNSDSNGAKELGEWALKLGFRVIEVKEVSIDDSLNFEGKSENERKFNEQIGFKILKEELEGIRFRIVGVENGRIGGGAGAVADALEGLSVSEAPRGGSFSSRLAKQKIGLEFVVQLCGRQNIPNLVMAIIAAKLSGVDESKLGEILRKIVGGKKNMEILKAEKVILIDDSYNTNPDGVRVTLEFLKKVKGKRKLVMVFAGMIELGDETEKEHVSVGKKIAECVDLTIISSGDFFEMIKNGWDSIENKVGKLLKIENEEEILIKLKNLAEKEELIILVEGRTGAKIIEYFRAISKNMKNV